MPIGILFWVLMILWFFGVTWTTYGITVGFGVNLLLFAVIALLGWQVFGPVLKK